MKYSISYCDNNGTWILAGNGDTDNGTTANLPQKVYDFADSGQEGELEVEGVKYRVTHK